MSFAVFVYVTNLPFITLKDAKEVNNRLVVNVGFFQIERDSDVQFHLYVIPTLNPTVHSFMMGVYECL